MGCGIEITLKIRTQIDISLSLRNKIIKPKLGYPTSFVRTWQRHKTSANSEL